MVLSDNTVANLMLHEYSMDTGYVLSLSLNWRIVGEGLSDISSQS